MRRTKRINYLSNKELLHHLNESKKSYCYFIDDKYSDYSIIIDDLNNIDDETIEKAKHNRATKLNDDFYRNRINEGLTHKKAIELLEQNYVKNEDIPVEDLVFRVMTFDHVPEDIKEIQKTLLNRIKFPPFKHYAYVNNELKEVGRSHWEGGLNNGHFTIENGKISNHLVNAIMLLTERYSKKASFRNYSYLEEMIGQALLQLSVVMLQFDEAKSNNPFAWYTQTIDRSFIKILKSEKKMRNIKDEIMMTSGYNASYGGQLDMEDN